MPILLANFDHQPVGIVLKDVVRIGRHQTNDLAFDSPELSTIHAIVRFEGGAATLEDNASRTGTFLNNQALTTPALLHHGDTFRVGSILFTYSSASVLPASIPTALPPTSLDSLGIFCFTCPCGRESLIAIAAEGRTGNCTRCHRELKLLRQVPSSQIPSSSFTLDTPSEFYSHAPMVIVEPTRTVPPPRTEPPRTSKSAERFCSICQTPILASENMEECSSCHLPFHRDCWTANLGCSAYGCPKVNILKKGPDISISPGQSPTSSLSDNSVQIPHNFASKPASQVEFILLGISIVAFIVGFFLFGVPDLFSGIANVGLLVMRGRRVNLAVIICALGLNLLGAVLGVCSSIFLYSRPNL